MSTFADIETEIESGPDATRLLALAEAVLELWIAGRGETPTRESRESFRLLALHRQGAQDLPSFNACRETCREIAYHYNLAHSCEAPLVERNTRMMALVVKHLLLFVSGKMQSERLGEFCCASKPLRQNEVVPALETRS